MKRVAVFIDNSNVYKGLVGHIRDFPGQWSVKQYDPLFLAQKLAGDRSLVAVYFYCAPPPQSLYDSNPNAFNSQNSYYAGVAQLENVHVKYATLSINNGVISEKNLDTQLTSDIMLKAIQNEFDQAIIISNDGDFVSAINGVRTLGKKVEVAHFREGMSMNLRQSADITRRLRPSHFVTIQEST